MSIDQIIVIVVSILGIGFTYWFFLGKSRKEIKDESMMNHDNH
jgi:cbb3-type cytochrome oxidase subunit 3